MNQSIVARSPYSDSAGAEVQLLRAYVERELKGPAVILVTSAKNGDGKSLTAGALADCLARSGRRTALVDTTANAALPGASGDGASALAVYVPMPRPKTPLARQETAQFVQDMRSSHEFTIIDSGALLGSEMTMAFAQNVDAVLLSVRLGRPPSDDDELTVRLLERLGARVLGVVASAPKAIALFRRRRTTGEQAAKAVDRKAVFGWRPVWRAVVATVVAVTLTLGAYEYVLGHAHGAGLTPAHALSAAGAAAPPTDTGSAAVRR